MKVVELAPPPDPAPNPPPFLSVIDDWFMKLKVSLSTTSLPAELILAEVAAEAAPQSRAPASWLTVQIP